MLLTSSWILDFLIFCVSLTFVAYKYFTRKFDYWKKRGVYSRKPTPFFGTFYDAATFKTTITELIKDIYDETDGPYFGIFALDEPILVLKSPKLIKDVLIKDFNIFCDRGMAQPKHNPTFFNFIFSQRNPAWKKTRTKLTPLFTSVMTKKMFCNLEQISEKFVQYLEKSTGIIDAKLVGSHFATEVIARCFYGVDPHCFDQEISLFAKHVLKIFEFSLRNAVIQPLYFLRPAWVEFFKLDLIENNTVGYFKGVFKSAMAAREDYNGKAMNLIDYMNSAIQNKEDNGDILELEVVIANAILFLTAGQETTSSLIGYALYELALNQNVQNKLREEIKINIEKYGGITYEGVQDIKYLDLVINETLRKYSTLPFLDRKTMSDYKIEGENLVIEKGTTVYIPLFALFRDPQHFPNPDKFDPERFLENNYNSDGLTFIPYGEGPRACIGKRLGQLSGAMSIANVILNFKLEKCESTPDPVEFEPKSLALLSKDGLPIKITSVS